MFWQLWWRVFGVKCGCQLRWTKRGTICGGCFDAIFSRTLDEAWKEQQGCGKLYPKFELFRANPPTEQAGQSLNSGPEKGVSLPHNLAEYSEIRVTPAASALTRTGQFNISCIMGHVTE